MISSHIPNRSPYIRDGKVDASVMGKFQDNQALVTGIQDSRVETILHDGIKKDASSLGDGWSASYRDYPIYGNRGINGLQQWSTFKGPGQELKVSWHEKKLTLDTEAPGSETGHRIEAEFGWDRKLKPDTITESEYIIAG